MGKFWLVIAALVVLLIYVSNREGPGSVHTSAPSPVYSSVPSGLSEGPMEAEMRRDRIDAEIDQLMREGGPIILGNQEPSGLGTGSVRTDLFGDQESSGLGMNYDR